MHALPGILFSIFVVVMCTLAFQPRHPEPQPKTELTVQKFSAMSLAQSDSHLIVVGDDGNVFTRENGQKDWQLAKVNGQKHVTLTDVAFNEKQQAVAVGFNSQILWSDDMGKNWHQVHYKPDLWEPLLGVSSLGPEQGWLAYGSYGKLYRSTTGKDWTQVQAGFENHINRVASNANGLIFLVGEAGLVAKSTDNGQTWITLPSFYKGSLFGVGFLGGTRWIAYGMSGRIFVTNDNGAKWQPVSTPLASTIFQHKVLHDGSIVFVGRAGSVLLANNQLTSFRVVSSGGLASLTSVAQLPEKPHEILVAGEKGVQLKSLY